MGHIKVCDSARLNYFNGQQQSAAATAASSIAYFMLTAEDSSPRLFVRKPTLNYDVNNNKTLFVLYNSMGTTGLCRREETGYRVKSSMHARLRKHM